MIKTPRLTTNATACTGLRGSIASVPAKWSHLPGPVERYWPTHPALRCCPVGHVISVLSRKALLPRPASSPGLATGLYGARSRCRAGGLTAIVVPPDARCMSRGVLRQVSSSLNRSPHL